MKNAIVILLFLGGILSTSLASDKSDLEYLKRVKTFNDSGKVMDLSPMLLKQFKLEDFNFKALDIPAIIKSMKPLVHNEKQATAVVIVLLQSSRSYFQLSKKLKESSFNTVIYKGELVHKETLLSAKYYLMMVIQEHPNKMLVKLAFSTLITAFKGDLDVVRWAQVQLSKADYSKFDPNIYNALFILNLSSSGEKEVKMRNILFRRGLKQKRKKIRENTLKMSVMSEFVNLELLPDIVSCLIANKDSARVAKWGSRVLKTYKAETVIKYQKELQNGLTLNQESPASYDNLHFLEWLNKQNILKHKGN